MFETDLEIMKEHILSLRKYTKNMRILVVEDYEVLQKSLEKIFTSLFMEVHVASDGVEALGLYKEKRAKNERYDIILSDIAMPNMDGVSLTKEIRALDKEQIILIFSAHQDSEYLLELINLEVRRFILKPISLNTLLDEILWVCKGLYDAKNLSQKISLRENIVYDKDVRELFIDGEAIKLTQHERLILELFLSKLNQTLSNEEIINHLFLHGIDIELSNVRKVVYKLRKKLANDLIENIHSIGYKIK